jgi:NAD+ diphosphatase
MFVFNGNGLLTSCELPVRPVAPPRDDYQTFGELRVALTDDPAPPGCEYRDFRWLGAVLDPATHAQAALAWQLGRWDATTRFCGRCGTANRYDPVEKSKHCPACGHRQYPAQFPVAIVAITRGDRLLLAHNTNFPEGLFSVIAGYVDLGETIEDTVRREVREEVGLEIDNVRYFGSQNWAPSSSLMLGFLAEWTGGEIRVDGVEITEADWYARDSLPAKLPMPDAIAGRMIEDWRNRARS